MSTLCLWVLCVASHEGTPTEELASLLRDGHRHSRGMIQSVSLKMEITDKPIPGFRPSLPGFTFIESDSSKVVEWWQSPSAIRSRETYTDGSTVEFLLQGGLLRTLTGHPRSGGKPYLSGDIAARATLSDNNNPWVEGLFDMRFQPYPSVTDLLKPPVLQKIETVKTPGKKTLYRVFFKTKDGLKGELWFDPQYNYLVRKVVVVNFEGATPIEKEVLSFREIQPGLFFPAAAEGRYREGGKVVVTRTTRIRDVRFNEPIDPGVFQLKFPAGATVSDQTKGIVYIADDNEQPAGKPSPMPVAELKVVEYPTGHEKQAKSSYLWYALAALLGLLVVLGAGWVVWSRHKKANPLKEGS